AVTYATGSSPVAVISADWNRDGKPDLLVVAQNSAALDVFIGKGDGTFNAAVPFTAGNTTWLVAGDWNRDGKLDVAISYASTNNVGVLLNQSQ
ncbi:MAG: FG-GAP repeat domain-containing protein, partial [Polyangia bacterium]